MRDLLRITAIFAQVRGKFRKVRCSFPCDAFNRLLGLQLVWIEKDILENPEALRLEKIIQGKRDRPCGEVGIVCTNNNMVDVRDNQQWRILKGITVAQKLVIGFLQIGMFAFVFPPEKTKFRNIRPALSSTGLCRAHFKGIAFACWVCLHGRFVSHEAAQVDEMFLN
jgi:hypothetical protein